MSLFKNFVNKFTSKTESPTQSEVVVEKKVSVSPVNFEVKELPKDDIWAQPIVREIRDSDWEELGNDLLQSDLGRELTVQLIEAGRKSKDKPLLAIREKLESSMSSKSRETKPGVILPKAAKTAASEYITSENVARSGFTGKLLIVREVYIYFFVFWRHLWPSLLLVNSSSYRFQRLRLQKIG